MLPLPQFDGLEMLTVSSQAEVYAAIWVACMPSLARLWNVKFKETKLYLTLRSLLGSVQSTVQSKQPPTGDSGSQLQIYSHYVEINHGSSRGSNENYQKDESSIYQLVTVDVSSETAPKR